jgi:hypothetical protein
MNPELAPIFWDKGMSTPYQEADLDCNQHGRGLPTSAVEGDDRSDQRDAGWLYREP